MLTWSLFLASLEHIGLGYFPQTVRGRVLFLDALQIRAFIESCFHVGIKFFEVWARASLHAVNHTGIITLDFARENLSIVQTLLALGIRFRVHECITHIVSPLLFPLLGTLRRNYLLVVENVFGHSYMIPSQSIGVVGVKLFAEHISCELF